MLKTAISTFYWPVVVTLCSTFHHQALNLSQTVVEFPFRFLIPIDLENRVFTIPQNPKWGGASGTILDQLQIGEQLHGMGEMGVARNSPGLLFEWNELTIDDDYLVGTASQSGILILE